MMTSLQNLGGPVAVAAVAVVLLAAERLVPLRRRTRLSGRRIGVNVAMSAMAFAVGALVVRPTALRLIGWTSEANVGILPLAPLPAWARVAAALVLMDLTFYYWHRLNHRWGLLWRFHGAHHADGDMDVTTSFRFHPVEVLYSTAFRAAQVTVLGVSLPTYAAYEAVFQCATVFHHSNLRMPIGLERLLNLLIVTPRMHGVHHSVVGEETNSNYSVVLRCWDLLHRTLRLNVPQARITIGAGGWEDQAANTLRSLLLRPFAPPAAVRSPKNRPGAAASPTRMME